jgi:hypothetical protein
MGAARTGGGGGMGAEEGGVDMAKARRHLMIASFVPAAFWL